MGLGLRISLLQAYTFWKTQTITRLRKDIFSSPVQAHPSGLPASRPGVSEVWLTMTRAHSFSIPLGLFY